MTDQKMSQPQTQMTEKPDPSQAEENHPARDSSEPPVIGTLLYCENGLGESMQMKKI